MTPWCWAHLVSAKFAFGRAFECYLFVSVILFGVLCYFEPIFWASGIEVRFKIFVLWEAVKDRLLFGNSVAANLAAVSTPLLYCAHRATFYGQNRLQALRLKVFAITEPDHLLQNNQDEAESVADGPEEFVDGKRGVRRGALRPPQIQPEPTFLGSSAMHTHLHI
jgi:hypothetical protein